MNEFVEKLKEIYKGITMSEEMSHNYLGMIMTHNREKQTVDIDMKKYIAPCVEEFQKDEPDEEIRLVNTPATNFPFRTKDAKILSKKRAGIFHSLVAKLLFVAKHALLAITFLASRVKNPDIGDWVKMLRVIGYLMNTEGIHLLCVVKKYRIWFGTLMVPM